MKFGECELCSENRWLHLADGWQWVCEECKESLDKLDEGEKKE